VTAAADFFRKTGAVASAKRYAIFTMITFITTITKWWYN
jgi:hypothetical protein